MWWHKDDGELMRGPKHSTTGFNLFVLDDEEAIRFSLAMLLEAMGHKVVTARDGASLLEEIDGDTSCDVALLDLTIIDGIGARDLVPLLREKCPEAKLVVTSGFSSDPVLDNFRAYGFDDKLEKPFGMSQLSALFERLAVVH